MQQEWKKFSEGLKWFQNHFNISLRINGYIKVKRLGHCRIIWLPRNVKYSN